jgi:preprotein translocase subunit SecF
MESEEDIRANPQVKPVADISKKPFGERFGSFYNKAYKFILFIPIALLLCSLVYMISFTVQTGDIIHKDVSLTGGTSLTIYTENISIEQLESALIKNFSGVSVIKLTDFSTGRQLALTVESSAQPDELKAAVEEILGYKLNDENSSVEFTGEALSKSFYKELIFAIAIAFAFMSIVIFIIFRVPLPSAYVVACALTDIMVPMTVVNLIGLRLSTAGIAAFLMLVGYSVDTDILLTMRVLKRKEEALNSRIYSSFKTGITMTLTSIAAVTVGYFVTISPVLKQIFFILIIGLLTDIVATWLMNASLIKWYCEKRGMT